MLKNAQNVKNARIFLFVDAIAPVFGIIVASFFTINQTVLAVILAAFAGQFLYIGAASSFTGNISSCPLGRWPPQ